MTFFEKHFRIYPFLCTFFANNLQTKHNELREVTIKAFKLRFILVKVPKLRMDRYN